MAHVIVKQRLFDLNLDQLALLLDHHDQVQILGPVMEALHVQRPDLPHFIGRDPQPLRLCCVDVQQGQRMHQI